MEFGLALGGGGARGLAHVPMLAAIDELGLRPRAIAGTSIGAVMGALYASGLSGAQIQENLEALMGRRTRSLTTMLLRGDMTRLINLLDPKLGSGGLLKGEKFLAYLYDLLGVDTFEELAIPLKVVAADFWSRQEVVFSRGPLLPALHASMALPWIFRPVEHNGRLLVDGGLVNPLPYDLLRPECQPVVAIDVLGAPSQAPDRTPAFLEILFNSFQIMEHSIVRSKLKHAPPDVYIQTDASTVQLLEFYRLHEIQQQARPAAERLRRHLTKLLPAA